MTGIPARRIATSMLALAACLLGEGGANAADRGHGIVSFVAATADGPVAAALQGAERARQILSGGQAPSPQDVEELISLAPQVNAGAVAAFKAGQLDEAVMLFETALGIDEAVLPPKHPKLVQSLHNLAFVYQKARLFDDAEAAYRRALALREELLPANHPEVAINLADLGSLLANTGRPEQAEPLYERALAIREASLPENDPLIVRSLVQLADTYNLMGRYAKQEPLMRRALAMQEASLPADHPDIAATLNKLAGVLGDLGQEAQAESLYRRALSIRERSYPENHPAISATLADLANTLVNLGRFEEAEALHLKALAMRETVAADHPDVAASLHALAGLHEDLGHYDEAETLLKRAIAIREQFPDGRRRLANSLSSLADLYKEAGRYAESETLSKRALAIRQEILPEGHAEISISLNGLASTYAAAQRYDEAEELFQRSLELREAALPAGHSLIRTAFNNLASLYETTGRYDDAEALYMRALGGVAPASISDPALADTIDNLARLYDRTARPEEALPLHERALALMEASLPASHPSIATNLNNQAATLDRLGLHAKAENLRRRSLEINENALPATHPNRIAGLTNLAYSIARQERFEEASSLSRRAIASILEAGADDAETFRGDFLQDASLSLQLEPDANAGTHAFAAHQWPMGGAAGAAIAAANARGSGSDELRALARRSDRLGEEIAATDRLLTTALAAAGNRTLVEELRGRYDRLLAERAAAEASMAKLFPAYADLSGPKPLTVAEAQSLLGPKEALVSFMLTGDAAIPGFVFAVTADGLGWGWIKDSEEVWRLSGELRALMTGGNRSAASLSAKETPSEQRARDIPAIAHRLHELLLGPVAERLAGKRDLIIVPDPFLADLPMHLLVTQKPEDGASPAQAFRAARWLIRDHTVTVLPAISSLRSLRQHSGKTASAAKPFLAFADPVIGSGGAMRCAEPAALQAVDAPDAPLARSVDIGSAALFRSGVAADGQMLADVEIVRGLPRLADTRCEALAIAAALGGSPADLLFEGDATETRLKQLSQTGALAQQRVLLFATHGLAPGEIGSAEPALVLTPPRQASSTDDGLLTASEVAGLDLNADFVILSACNTASAGATGGQSFSGLARAFFYAGAKSLLVSHWPVYSDAAVKLTTRALAAGAGVSRAEAMRLAMLSMIDDAAQPADADPVRWAPFSLVGESSGI